MKHNGGEGWRRGGKRRYPNDMRVFGPMQHPPHNNPLCSRGKHILRDHTDWDIDRLGNVVEHCLDCELEAQRLILWGRTLPHPTVTP